MKLRIELDDCYESPRSGDNVGTMVCWHRRYTLGDEQPSESPEEWVNNLADSFLDDIPERVERAANYFYGTSSRFGDVAEAYLEKARNKVLDQDVVLLPLYLYDHGSITMNTGGFHCPWDSGQVGFIYTTMDQARKEWSGTDEEVRDKALACLEAEVKVYDQYLTGDVWGYVIEDDEGEEVESVWGFYGDEYCREAGEEALKSLMKEAA